MRTTLRDAVPHLTAMHIPFVDAEFSRLLESAETLPSIEAFPVLQRWKPSAGSAFEPIAGGWMFYAGPNSPLNHAIGMGLEGPVAASELDRVEEFYRSRKSVAEVVVSPLADGSLLDQLGARGFHIGELNSVLVRSLAIVEVRGIPSAVEVRQIARHEEDALAWSKLIIEGFTPEDAPPEMQLDPELFVPFAFSESSYYYRALIGGKAVGGGACSVFPDKGLASLYGTSTLAPYRNQGVQTALLSARIRRAADAGCKWAVVVTQPGTGSQRNAERAGFRLAYTKMVFQKHY